MKRSSVRQSFVGAFRSLCYSQSRALIALRGVNFMSEARAIGSDTPTNRMPRFTAFAFGAVSYLTSLFTILYAIGFVSDFVVPKSIDSGAKTPTSEALAVNLALMSLFALQHSTMARSNFKQRWTQFIPKPIERSAYVLFASLTLLLLFWQWRPIPAVVRSGDHRLDLRRYHARRVRPHRHVWRRIPALQGAVIDAVPVAKTKLNYPSNCLQGDME